MTHMHHAPSMGTPLTVSTFVAIAIATIAIATIAIIVLIVAVGMPSVAYGKKMVFEPNRVEHIQYFPQTDYLLDVYIIDGAKPGPTALIVGGIQGDEEGGYLAADQFIDMSIDAGRLIVIPRANAKAVAIAERMTVVDMNRQFKDITYEKMRGAVETIKKYIAEADVFINFHDGWGFHRKTYTDWSYSPDRFGQSVVTDSDEYTCHNDTTINLREPAFIAISSANERINLEKYYLAYFNTRTFEDTSKYYASMTNASTYYVLTAECKPAFAVEASKNLPTIKDKVLVHIYAAIPLLKYYGIVVNESVAPVVEPVLSRVVMGVNGVEYALTPSSTINATIGDTVTVAQIYGNYQRGYTADVVGIGGVIDNAVPYKMERLGRVEVNIYKDSVAVGKVFVQVRKGAKPEKLAAKNTTTTTTSTSTRANPETVSLFAELNGQRKLFPLGQNIVLKRGDSFTPIDLVLADNSAKYSVRSINIKGFVPAGVDGTKNTGNDMGYEMVAGISKMITQYALEPTAEDRFGVGEVYPIVVSYLYWGNSSEQSAGQSPQSQPLKKTPKTELFYIQLEK